MSRAFITDVELRRLLLHGRGWKKVAKGRWEHPRGAVYLEHRLMNGYVLSWIGWKREEVKPWR